MKRSLPYQRCLLLFSCLFFFVSQDMDAQPTKANHIQYNNAAKRFTVTCKSGGTDVACKQIDFQPYQFFWEFGNCGYSFRKKPAYTFKGTEAQTSTVRLKRSNIYDEDFGPAILQFTDTFNSLPQMDVAPPASNGKLDLGFDFSKQPRGDFETIIVIQYMNRTGSNISDASIEFEMSPRLGNSSIQSCCRDFINFNKDVEPNKEKYTINLGPVASNERCNLYLIYDVDPLFSNPSFVGSNVNLKASSFVINKTPDKQNIQSTFRLSNAEAVVNPSDVESLNLKVVESHDPNAKKASPPGCISAQDLIEYTVSFSNEGTAPTHFIDIRDTLDDHLDMATFAFTKLNILGTDQSLSNATLTIDGHAVRVKFPASLPPTTNENETQGFIRFVIKPRSDVVGPTDIFNRASIIFDNAASGILTNQTKQVLNCKTIVAQTNFLFVFLLLFVILLCLIILFQVNKISHKI